jgi:hypothetical protein
MGIGAVATSDDAAGADVGVYPPPAPAEPTADDLPSATAARPAAALPTTASSDAAARSATSAVASSAAEAAPGEDGAGEGGAGEGDLEITAVCSTLCLRPTPAHWRALRDWSTCWSLRCHLFAC